MKKKRYSTEQIVSALKQAEMGMPVAEFTSQIVDLWAYHHKIRMDDLSPTRPAFISRVCPFHSPWFEIWRARQELSSPHARILARS